MNDDQALGNWDPDSIDRILELLPILEQAGFVACEWEPSRHWEEGGKPHMSMPYPTYHPAIERFRRSIFRSETPVDPYRRLPEDRFEGKWDGAAAVRALSRPEQFAGATLGQVRRYLLLCARGEHFSDGHIESEIESGNLLAALRRLKRLRDST